MIQERIYSRLASFAGLTALVGTRISPMLSIEKGMLPCVTYQMIGALPVQTQDGEQDMRDPSVQVDAWALTYDEARAVATQVCAALRATESPLVGIYPFIENDGTDAFEPDTRFHRCMVEARIWYRG